MASVLFHQNGYHGTTVRALAKILGIQSGSLFHYFGSKEELLTGVMEDALLNSISMLRRNLAGLDDVKMRLLVVIRTELEIMHAQKNSGWAVLFTEWRNLSEESKVRLLKLREEYNSIWMDVINDGKRSGIIVGDPVVSRMLCFGALSWTTKWYKNSGVMKIDELAKQAYHLLVKGGTSLPSDS